MTSGWTLKMPSALLLNLPNLIGTLSLSDRKRTMSALLAVTGGPTFGSG